MGSQHYPYNTIDAQITQIDLRYVEQADFVAVWRPFSGGFQSLGCYREASTAADLHKEVIAYCPAEDQEAFQRNNEMRPLQERWPPTIPLVPDKQQFWTMVSEAVERLSKRRVSCKGPLDLPAPA